MSDIYDAVVGQWYLRQDTGETFWVTDQDNESGTVEIQTSDGDLDELEPACRTILQFDNASDNEPAEIVCYYLADTSDRPAIEMLEGGMASQLGQH